MHGRADGELGGRSGCGDAWQAILPDPFNADTWNLNALSSITTRYKVGVSSSQFNTPYSIPKYGAWAQDDWTLGPRLTLNLGVRWDLAWNGFAQEVTPGALDGAQPAAG